MERMNNINKYGYSSLLTESQESKSQDKAKTLVQQCFGWNRERADKFVREELRNDITALRDKKIGKFTLGVTRMYCDGQIQDASTISNLNTTLALMIPHINEYDQNLNGLSAEELINRFKQIRQDNTNQKRGEIDSIQFGESQYTIIPINSYEEAQKYYKYTYNQSRWCLTHKRDMYDAYTCDGINQIYFCLKNGFENIEPIVGANAPLDEYGLSMISVIVNESGELAFCTCRWNHGNGGSDSVMDEVTLSKVLNVNFYNVFKPNNKWASAISECIERLKRGEKPGNIFDGVWRQDNGLYLVKLMNKYNFLRPDGTFVWEGEKWFDRANDFDNGTARVYIEGKGGNYLYPDGTFLWEGEKWFAWVDYFRNGFGLVKIEGKGWNFLRPDGTLVWKGEKWFDDAYKFYDGFAMVYIKGKGWNYLRSDGTLVWKGEKWFDETDFFNYNGFAIVFLDGEEFELDKDGNLHDI